MQDGGGRPGEARRSVCMVLLSAALSRRGRGYGQGGAQDGGGRSAEKTKRGAVEFGCVEGRFRRRGRGGTQDGGGRSAEKTKRGAAESRGAFDGEAGAELRTEEGDQQRRPRGVLRSRGELSTARPGRNSGRRRAISREDQEGQVQNFWSQAWQKNIYVFFLN
ncbi:uncharacterized protein LOC121177642 isoform X9 [Toxotes jaculatrix]|uniref:uncharacterized protein LOC121177642 isoform X9 n=1 Tax=Toxotes jaculatrix TaxID=941984 RepID=UPI001B3B167B|nr:uncharacterized protein LOC121177642 isoform X9 [Toxotes jaculatrix]